MSFIKISYISAKNSTIFLPATITKNKKEGTVTIPNVLGREIIDLDILFWGSEKIEHENLQIPHPRLFERSFVVLPLSELPGFKILEEFFDFKFHFNNQAKTLRD